MRLLPALLLATGAVACIHAPVRGTGPGATVEVQRFSEAGARFRIEYLALDTEAAQQVEKALRQAARRVRPWGDFSDPVVVRLYPSHAALEEAVHRIGYPWLRAWARYDEIFLQSPRTYGPFEGGLRNLAELLTHELTHCLMYQQAGTRSNWLWRDRQIPIWFREGMASWTAQQGRRRMSEARLTEWMLRSGHDPLREAPALYQKEAEAVYAAAHWAFTFLVERYGAGAVRGLLDRMQRGGSFDGAFEAEMGLSLPAFEAEFVRYLRWHGWVDRRHLAPREVFGGAPATRVRNSGGDLSGPRVVAAPADARPPGAVAAARPR